MNAQQETFETWEKVASLYQEKYMDLDIYNATYDYVCNTITARHAKILEIGCGPGNITRYLLSKRPDFNILCTDTSANMISLAQENNPAATYSILDCRDLHTLAPGFDGIVGGFCLPYISQEDCPKLITDCYNLLNPGGLLYLSFMEGDPAASGFQAGSSGHRAYFYYHRIETLEQLLLENGFAHIQVFRILFQKEEVHTVVVCSK